MYCSAYYFITSILLFSGFAKIIDPLPLIKILEAFNLFSFTPFGGEINFAITAILPLLEIGLAILLIMKVKLKVTLSLTLLLFTGFLFYAIYGYYLGITNDCGCFGDIIKSEFGVGMILRNFIFIAIIIYIVKQYLGKSKKNLLLAGRNN